MHPATGTKSVIDLTVSSPEIFLDFQWKVNDDQCVSDHDPIVISYTRAVPMASGSNWKFNRANWVEFQRLCDLALIRSDALIIIIIKIFGPLLKRHTMTEVISRALYTITNYNVLNSSSSPVSSHTGKLT